MKNFHWCDIFQIPWGNMPHSVPVDSGLGLVRDTSHEFMKLGFVGLGISELSNEL